MLKRRNNDKGFTLIEIIVTTTIIAMLAAFAVPTFIGYVEAGNQTKRMNIAQTIYLAAQNKLTEKRINQTLATFSMTKEEAEAESKVDPSFVKPSEFAADVLDSILPEDMSDDESENIVYISKSQGTSSGMVYDLLDSVIQDKTVLNNAILIEYNKTTGFVLSVFYSEENSLNFTYDELKDDNKYSSIDGGRPYAFADERRQGYCGIEETGMLPTSDEDAIINIIDGETTHLSDGIATYENVLYAEILIPKSMIDGGQKYNLQVFSESGEPLKTETLGSYETGNISLDNLKTTVDSAVAALLNKTDENMIYRQTYDESSILDDYAKVIWILDYVNGDMTSQDTSIGLKIAPQNIRAGISGNGISEKSLSVQNSHFSYEVNDKDYIESARHLNNVRYKLDGYFRQLKDIDTADMTNFLPIGSAITPALPQLTGKSAASFTGTYFARKEDGTYAIKNLNINTAADNAGLFATIDTGGLITGLTLENPAVKGSNNAGALAGSNSGEISLITVTNTDTQQTQALVQGTNNIGGIVGINSGKLTTLSFENNSLGTLQLVQGTNNVGGIAGTNSGEITSAELLNKDGSMKSAAIEGTSNTGGIVGLNSGKLTTLTFENNSQATVNMVKGTNNVGGIVGSSTGLITSVNFINKSGVEQTSVAGTGSNVGGIAGLTSAKIENAVFLSASTKAAVSGVSPTGGIAGTSSGNFENVLYLAVAPKFTISSVEKITPIAGTSSATITNAVYLAGKAIRPVMSDSLYNSTAANFGTPKSTSKIYELTWSGWSKTSGISNPLNTASGASYPYMYQLEIPYETADTINWPIADEFDVAVTTTTLKYFEKYSNGTYGYYYYKDETTRVDSLEYNPDLTVVEEGYLVEMPSSGTYSVRFNGSTTSASYTTVVYDSRNVIKLSHKVAEALIDSSKISTAGITPVKIEVSLSTGTFTNLLAGAGNGKSIYFDPLFAKQIFVVSTPSPQNTLEVRSPRQILNVNGKETTTSSITKTTVVYTYPNLLYEKKEKDINVTASGSNPEIIKSGSEYIKTTTSGTTKTVEIIEYIQGYYKDDGKWNKGKAWAITEKAVYTTVVIPAVYTPVTFDLKQTISINFGVADEKTAINSRPAYTWETGYNDTKAKIANNIMLKLISNYDAGVYYKDYVYYGGNPFSVPVIGTDGRAKRNRIYNLVMNVTSPTSETYAGNTGGAFGTVAEGVTVQNLEFVDPQIRYSANGRGGGIVTNTNLGTIDNVQVYNEVYTRSLFANSSGNTDTVFCHSGSSATNDYGHNHGGIAGQNIGAKAKISNCIVGTNSATADGISNNKTIIKCYQEQRYDGEWATTRVGGIAGFAYGKSKIISCINLAKINATWSTDSNSTVSKNSPYALGGIAGAIGLRSNTPSVSYVSGYSYPSSASIIGCYNAGNLTLKNGWVAGIAGYSARNSAIWSCYNTGRINVEGTGSALAVTSPLSNQPLRIGGIAGETEGCSIISSYNIGYVSGTSLPSSGTQPNNSASGAIIGLPAYSESKLEYCYSLGANKFRPVGIVGKLFDSAATVNGFSTSADLTKYFTTWQTAAQLKANSELVSSTYIANFPAINDDYRSYDIGDVKEEPVFTVSAMNSSNFNYPYPQLSTFTYGGVVYNNPHRTPWEDITAG